MQRLRQASEARCKYDPIDISVY